MRRIIGAATAALFSVIMFAGAPASAAPASDGVTIMGTAAAQEFAGPDFQPIPGVTHAINTDVTPCVAVAIPNGVQSAINSDSSPNSVRYYPNTTCTGTTFVTIAPGDWNANFNFVAGSVTTV